MIPIALTIAGSDPSGGAGIQADLKTFHQHGVFGTSVVTLLTAQNTVGVQAIELLSPAFVLAQLESVLSDVPPLAAKTGALGSAELVEAIAEQASRFAFPLVVDPVMVSKHGHELCDGRTAEAIRTSLLPHSFLATPNLAEAERLSGVSIRSRDAMLTAAQRIASLGAQHVLIKFGLRGVEPVDLLWSEGRAEFLAVERIETTSTHGTGCTLSAAIAARLARGESLRDAILGARRFVHEAIRSAPAIGGGRGPVNHFATAD